jgi:nitroreductase
MMVENYTKIDAILKRRSIRKYDKNKNIEKDVLRRLLVAAMYAPSARNLQPWQFILTANRNILNKIPDVHPYAKMMYEATAAILVCGDKHKDPNEFYLVKNCSAATQNILLEAYENGLGSIWLGVYGREERMKAIVELFELPEHIVPVSLVGLGYPAEEKGIPERYNENVIHLDQFGNPFH